MLNKMVLASLNTGKLREFAQLTKQLPITFVSQASFDLPAAEETGGTFVENAILKARHASAATGLPALADDTGLVVPALNGAPGIYSARYAGVNATSQDNVDKLLSEIGSLPDATLAAEFVCVIVSMNHAEDPLPIIATGRLSGQILKHSRGEHGFGYDGVFYLPSMGKTIAELGDDQKNSISHRRLAMDSWVVQMKKVHAKSHALTPSS